MPTRKTSAAKVSGAILAALMVLGGGYGGYEGISAVSARVTAVERGLGDRRELHEADVRVIREEIKGLREALSQLVPPVNATAAKVELIHGMLRDHMQGDK